jgi:hypothetical protein
VKSEFGCRWPKSSNGEMPEGGVVESNSQMSDRWVGGWSSRMVKWSTTTSSKQTSEVGSNAPSRSQKSEVRSQKSEVRSQKSEVRSQKSEVRSQKSRANSQQSTVNLTGPSLSLWCPSSPLSRPLRQWRQIARADEIPDSSPFPHHGHMAFSVRLSVPSSKTSRGALPGRTPTPDSPVHSCIRPPTSTETSNDS